MKRLMNIYSSSIGIGVIALIAGLFLSVAPANAAIYMEIEGIKGNCSSEDAQRNIEDYNALVPQINEQMAQLFQLADELRSDALSAREYEASSVKLQEAVALLQNELGKADKLVSQIKETLESAAGASGQSRRRGSAVLEDLSIIKQCDQQIPAIEEAVTIVGEIGTEFTA